jgi:hypothetical protein
METKAALTDKILTITLLIQERYPQLSEYLAEVQETLPSLEHPHVNEDDLARYYQTIEQMLKDYLLEHPEL